MVDTRHPQSNWSPTTRSSSVQNPLTGSVALHRPIEIDEDDKMRPYPLLTEKYLICIPKDHAMIHLFKQLECTKRHRHAREKDKEYRNGPNKKKWINIRNITKH
ncbi:hypothetical protein ACRALDRAFT_206927 [Sodiomyces alcalophilus JCM 7366]|uniref:uncharacterized protein n=1 Tax=Sodiomyces alcalophilus JCM 7366 TaxID=591952 RepID=UPI0039B5852F